MKEAFIYHIADKFDWEKSNKEYSHPSLDSEGFIHCSTGKQLIPTYEKYYTSSSNLLLLEIDSFAVGSQLKWELAPSRGEEFPHIYSPIKKSWVLDSYPLTNDLLKKFAEKFGN
ncbi:MAG: DUF952 domain-containing protein [Bdellovibrionota bacterium]|nr:hypothetical protein [Pseudobdellovibrionaceae bacterium]|tara:strand:+ start:85649 stop:85990 length:342 start_codon:yes stop_codon:yes gene_type:complete